MAATRLSPTANLLRNSRLFALPPPLPRPSSDITSTAIFFSDTATLPYPTHAAIETTQSSLSRGDWGLKRPLPLKSTTATSTPMIRINAIDSIDHITNYDSAADHTLTLQKWQEMELPISMSGPTRTTATGSLMGRLKLDSVFESHNDNTETGNGDAGAGRWKFKGPWLPGKSEGEFQEFVGKRVKRRKSEFRRFLHEKLAEQRLADQKRVATERGLDIEPSPSKITDQDFEAHIKNLRHNESQLHILIEQFFDIPTVKRVQISNGSSSFAPSYVEQPPPKTHPSAGLTYLRTASHISNHPMLGPLEGTRPIQGRVIVHQSIASVGNLRNPRGLIGVAGVVCEDTVSYTWDLKKPSQGVTKINSDVPGGAKTWVHPAHASIDPQGRINLKLEPADVNALAVHLNQAEDQPDVFGKKNRNFPSSVPPRPFQTGQGYGLEDTSGVDGGIKARSLSSVDEKTLSGDDSEIVKMIHHLPQERPASSKGGNLFRVD